MSERVQVGGNFAVLLQHSNPMWAGRWMISTVDSFTHIHTCIRISATTTSILSSLLSSLYEWSGGVYFVSSLLSSIHLVGTAKCARKSGLSQVIDKQYGICYIQPWNRLVVFRDRSDTDSQIRRVRPCQNRVHTQTRTRLLTSTLVG